MRPQWPISCLVLLLVAPTSILADDLRLLNVGGRGGVSGLAVLGKGEQEDFQQYDLFATASLPWNREWRDSGWEFSSRLMGTAGGLLAAGDEGFVGAIVPLLALGPKDSILAVDAGVGGALMTRYKFGEQNFGGVFQFVLTVGVRVPVYRSFGVGYRLTHMSDATLYGSHSRGADIHALELTYNFAEPTSR